MSNPCIPCSAGTIPSSTPPFPAFPPPVGGDATPGGGGTPVDPCSGVNPAPTVSTEFVAPAVGSQGQLYSACAYVWAIPNLDLLLPPFGRVTITAVNGTLVTFINRTIPAGTTVGAGTPMSIASGWDFAANPNPGNGVDFLLGTVGGYPVQIPGDVGMIMKRVMDTDNVPRWRPFQPATNGMLYYPRATPTDFFSTTGAGSSSVNLPGMPAGLIPCVPVINVKLSITCNNTRVFSRKVQINGAELWNYSAYCFAGISYLIEQPIQMPGYSLCGTGNPVNVTITDGPDNTAFTIDEFKLSLAGWHY